MIVRRAVHQAENNQLVDGIIFSLNNGVVMTGIMVNSAEKVNVSLWSKPWFFKHFESFFKSGPAVRYIPLRDYQHRHSRSIFWEIQDIIPFGNHPVFRFPSRRDDPSRPRVCPTVLSTEHYLYRGFCEEI